MHFDLTQEQRRRSEDLRTAAEALGGEPRNGPSDHVDRSEWSRTAAAGFTGLCLPEEFGGGGLGALDTAQGLQDLSTGSGDTGLAFAVAAHLLAGAVPVRDFGGGELRTALLPGAVSGDLVLANAITEAQAGSDVGNLATTARRDADSYVLNGTKTFVSNAPLADVFVVYATTDPGGGPFATTAFAVPGDAPGVEVKAAHSKMGLHGCPASAVEFRDCRFPASLRIGAQGQGSAVFQHAMAWERACLPAIYLGAMEQQVRDAVSHARLRHQFGHRLADFQAVSHRVVDMHQRLEGARLLLQRACWLLDGDRGEAPSAVASAKLAVTEAAVANALDALHLRGAEGYLAGSAVERQLRDSVPGTLFSGTSEIQREVIARGLGL
ncbi:acyl-CoA dehydrogenase family protein [Nocardiopsis quinghaiensis]|uniref:acyl-CoA dehydrogenase family protein n=1 Tax=Nocardiopsis quinghaiensis TaxID=464995 RepID=UPI001238A897|nr:acyl-CoA dehydrogenase family protein [Nocardiopsis quinghaiensis]